MRREEAPDANAQDCTAHLSTAALPDCIAHLSTAVMPDCTVHHFVLLHVNLEI